VFGSMSGTVTVPDYTAREAMMLTTCARRLSLLVLIVLGAQGATRLETAAKSAEPQAAQDISQPSNNTRTSKEELERWMKELSNRGRWGKDDERGTLNLITAAKQKQAAFDRLKTQGSGLRA
jgi:hypothetical protein